MFKNMRKTLLYFIIICLSLFTSGCGNTNEAANTPKVVVREKESIEKLVIKKSDVSDIAKFYPVIIDDIKMEVIAVMATDNTIRTSFNACQVCADSGRGYYIQDGHKLVCQNCGNAFDIDDLELVKDGCNPAPITKKDKTEDEQYITIPKTTFIKNKNLYL